MRYLSTIVAAAAVTAAFATPARTATVTLGGVEWNTDNTQLLQLTPVVPGGNQPLNVQCIICGDHQPQQQGQVPYRAVPA